MPHKAQTAFCQSQARFRVVPAGRRSGKTERAKRQLIKIAVAEYRWQDPRYFMAAPTRDQAKAIFWQDLKAFIPPTWLLKPPSETALSVTLLNGAEIHVIGMDKPERIEGRPWNGGNLDEYGNMKAIAWSQNIRPALSDRGGFCWFTGVPEGRNHYYDLALKAQADETGEWGYYHWMSSDILPPEEIESARRDLDELSFKQEYEGSFVSFQGAAYYAFDRAYNCERLFEKYDELRPLIFCFDFNVEPGVAVVCQEMKFESGRVGTGVIGEVHIPRNSNTEAVCRVLAKEWGQHRGYVYVYGDATGGSRGSAKTAGSDWDIVRRELRAAFRDRVVMKVPKANPTERSRVNAMNTRLKSGDGTIRMMIDLRHAPELVKDLEGTRLLEGGSGELDKRRDPRLTHWTDSIGYYVRKEFPIDRRATTHEELST